MAKTVELAALRATLQYRGDESEFTPAIKQSMLNEREVSLGSLLDHGGLEKTSWALRALPQATDPDVRRLACEVVENLLARESHLYNFISDDYPAALIAVARKYADGTLEVTEAERLARRELYEEAITERNRRWSTDNPALFGPALTKAAAYTLLPDARIGAYFSIMTAHSRHSDKETSEAEHTLKFSTLKRFVEA